MDDPWGSPWAGTDSDKVHKLASPDLVPPPRAFLSATSSPRIPAVAEQSPWAGDEDGFEEWATPSETSSAQAAWGAGWGTSSPNLTPTPRDEVLNKSSPIAWPGNVATPNSANSPLFRQPSPDPWTSALSPRAASNDGVSTPRLVVEAASSVETPIVTLRGVPLGIEEDTAWDRAIAGDTREQTSTVQPDNDAPFFDASGRTEGQGGLGAPVHDARISVDSAIPGHEYPSSTPSNDNTDREDDRPDSPITSIDEEAKPRPPEPRRVSGKVQELVVKFDGLARAASEERVVISRGRSKSPLSVRNTDGSDDATDFGDFEDGNEAPALPTSPTLGGGCAKRPEVGDSCGALPPLQDQSASSTSPIARFGPIYFTADLGSVTDLFPGLPNPALLDVKIDRDVPDHIIKDSFIEISERKAWYRISRLGSARRHNAGDDESYRRVAWPTSTVHHDTIKIVRRWMEEDSIAGRVALGGGISKTQKNMFGWDSSAEPVALDAVFGKKRLHSRASSLQTPSLPLGEAAGKKASPRPAHRSSGSVGPTIASFGWSSSSPTSATQALPADTLRQTPDSPTTLLNPSDTTPQVHRPTSRATSTKDIIGLTSQIPTGTPPARGGNEPVVAPYDIDEEWGEMVSSPILSEAPVTSSAEQRSRAVPSSAALGETPSSEPVLADPWTATQFSAFERHLGQPSSQARLAHADPDKTRSSSLEDLALDSVVKAPLANVAAPPSSDGTASGPPASRTAGQHAAETGSERPATDLQLGHEVAASRIVSNLPDLSYMLR